MAGNVALDDRLFTKKEDQEKEVKLLDEEDAELLKVTGSGPYEDDIKALEKRIQEKILLIQKLAGVKEAETGLAPPSQWDLDEDRRLQANEHALLVARVTKVLNKRPRDAASALAQMAALAEKPSRPPQPAAPGGGGASSGAEGGAAEAGKEDLLPEKDWTYVINIKHTGKYVVKLDEQLGTVDVEEGSRVGVDSQKYVIKVPLPLRIDPLVTMLQVEEKPDCTYDDVGGAAEQIKKVREVVELPLADPERFARLGIDPPKGVLLYGPPGTGKTLCARAVANATDSCFIRVIGSELVQRYVGEGARIVRELFQMARTKRACIIFFDEIDAVGGTRHDDGPFGDNEVQRTMLEIVNQLDGFDSRGNIKVIMATNRPDTLDPALLRPGRLDRKIEFGLPDLAGRVRIFKIHAKSLAIDTGIRFELLSRLCPNTTGAEIRSVCTEAGMFAIRARRKVITEKDFLDAIQKVIKGYKKFSATPSYMAYN